MLVGLGGFSVIDRYLLVASMVVIVFAGVALAGWTMLARGTRARRVWAVAGRRSSSSPVRSITAIARRPVPAAPGALLPRRRPSCAARRPRRRSRPGRGCGADRSACPTTSSSPTSAGSSTCPTAAVVARSEALQRARALRARGSSAAAWPSTRTTRAAVLRQALVEKTDDPVHPAPARRLRARGRERVLLRLCPLLAPLRASGAGRAALASCCAAVQPPAIVARRSSWPWWVALGARAARRVRCCGIWGADHGLPYAYNADENSHFVPRAIGIYQHEWNPDYFVNPPAFTYVLNLVFTVWFGGRDGVSELFASRPDRGLGRRAHDVGGARDARGLAALPGRVAAVRPPRRPARRGAAWPSRFLPVFYSHLALNDVPTLAPLCLGAVGGGGGPAPRPARATT